MATHLTPAELRNMQVEELRKDIASKRLNVAKMRMDVAMRSEKDTARYLREKKELARLLTIMREKEMNGSAEKPALKTAAKTAKVPASASKKTAKKTTSPSSK